VRAGKLRELVTVQRRVTSQNTTGEAVISWLNDETVWAEMRNDAGAELSRIRQVYGERSVELRVRLPLTVSITDRIMHGGRILEIVAVLDPDQRSREARLVCREPLE
jgi:SPP1 family predicted phage head-tail adaptor